VEYGKGFLDSMMAAAVICADYGWTYEQYLAQPTWFIELIKGKMKIDSQREEKAAKKSKK